MAEKKRQISSVRGVGFVACYKGKEIAFSRSFKDLANTPKVKTLLGDKDLLIKHDARYTSSFLIDTISHHNINTLHLTPGVS